MTRGEVLRIVVWPEREWCINFMPREWRLEATAAAIRVCGEPKEERRRINGKRTRIRVQRKPGHRNQS